MKELRLEGKILKESFLDKSKIHGTGVYAMQTISRRSKIGSLSGYLRPINRIPKKFKSNESIAIVELSDSMVLDSREYKNKLCFINHSCEPNCYMRIINNLVEIYALRSIKKKCELTLDYGYTHHEGKRKCRCGSVKCKGAI
jgi:uncharacterized protein